MSGPKYRHDCQICTFLGHHDDSDLYYCPQGNIPTLVARYSSEPADYASGIAFVGIIPAITAAHKLAKQRGLVQ